MIDNDYLLLLAISVATAVALAALTTRIAIRLAPRLGFIDRPDGGRKQHRRPIPVLGGIAVLAGLLAGISLLPAESPSPQTELIQSRQFVLSLAISATLLCGVGLIDDRFGMRARYKFLGQILAILPFAAMGCSVESLNVLGLAIHLGPTIGILFAMLWLVSCTNAVNLIDGLDGLAGSIGLIVSMTIGLNAAMTGQWQAAALAFVFAGAIFGFLLFNWPPARIFLGDSGSMTIGFVVGALALGASVKRATGFALVVPLVLVSVPAFDTFMAILRRKLNGRSLGEPDRRHFHHRLKDRGLSDRRVLILMASVCLGMATCAVAATRFQNDWFAVAGCVAILSSLVVSRVFGHEEARLAIRHAQTIARWWTESIRNLRPRLTITRLEVSPADANEFWDECRRRVERMGGYHLSLTITDSDESSECTLLEQDFVDDANRWELRYAKPTVDGLTVSLVARGQQLVGQSTQLDGIYRAFESACSRWLSQRHSPVIPLPLPGQAVGATNDRRAA